MAKTIEQRIVELEKTVLEFFTGKPKKKASAKRPTAKKQKSKAKSKKSARKRTKKSVPTDA